MVNSKLRKFMNFVNIIKDIDVNTTDENIVKELVKLSSRSRVNILKFMREELNIMIERNHIDYQIILNSLNCLDIDRMEKTINEMEDINWRPSKTSITLFNYFVDFCADDLEISEAKYRELIDLFFEKGVDPFVPFRCRYPIHDAFREGNYYVIDKCIEYYDEHLKGKNINLGRILDFNDNMSLEQAKKYIPKLIEMGYSIKQLIIDTDCKELCDYYRSIYHQYNDDWTYVWGC